MKAYLLLTAVFLITISAYAQKPVTFFVTVPPDAGTRIGVRGNTPPLSWDQTLYLEKSAPDTYSGSTVIDNDVLFFEYKYVVEDGKGNTVYELDGQENRLGILDGAGNVTLNDTWDVMPDYDIKRLPLIPADKLQEDVQILGDALWKLHPGVERYLDSAEYFNQLSKLSMALNTPTSYADAYREISAFTAAIQCGHTFASPFNQTGFIKNIILNQRDKLPFGLSWIDGRLFISHNATENAVLTPGTEILAVNGVATEEFASDLLKLTKGDGANDAKRYKDLEVIGYDYYEMLDIYFPLIIHPEDGRYELKVRTTGGQEKDVSVAAVTRDDRNSVLLERYNDIPRSVEDTWSYRMEQGNIAYLKMGTFAVWNFRTDWKKLLKEAFRAFDKAGAENLIIDIRGNEGGADEVLAALQPYILKTDCAVDNFEERLRYASVPEELRPYVSTWDESILDFGDRVKKTPGGYYQFINSEPETMTFKGSRNAFEGEIYLLTDAANSSATFYLARFFRECGMGTLAGEPTGGSLKGINGGNVLFLRLPNSRVEVDIPVYGQFDDDAPDGGIQPDILIGKTRDDLINQTDGQLERLIERIRD